MSWVTLEDVVGILLFAIVGASLKDAVNIAPARGAINIVSPQPLRNAEFTKVLAKALRRPALFPAPAFALRLALGEMAGALLLSSQRVLPPGIEKLGYRFLHEDLNSALAAVLAKS
jgi:NAD dependent epimerase/dehydratase family enzyme